MALTSLLKPELRLILFGGKGGVGKTTCAASGALYLAENNQNTLLISTDPAHSLSDSLDKEIGDEITEIKGVDLSLQGVSRDRLSAVEISAEKALSKFKGQYSNEIKRLLDTSTYLGREDIEEVFSLPIPGIDEVMGFKTIVDLLDEARFDKYVVDTAPTGHALRLLTFPELLDDWIKVMAKIRWRYRYIKERFAGRYIPDEVDEFLLDLKKMVKRIEGLLRDSARCEFIVVTIPEGMAILETERLLERLTRYGIRVGQLIINNVVELRDCEFCREKRKEQEGYINKIRERFADMKITIVPLQPREVKGIEALEGFKGLLFQ